MQENVKVNVKVNDHLFVETGLDYYYNRLKGQPAAQLTNLSGGIRYKRNNWDLSLNLFNLLNQQHYAETTQGADHLTIDTFQTFPRFVLAGVKVHF